MYDLIKTKQTPHVEPFVGMYLRATGNGQQLLKVHTYDATTRSGTVISCARLNYGRMEFAKKAYIRPFTAHPGHSGNHWMVTVPNSGYNQGWAYLPIEIYSVHPTAKSAYEMGVRSGKAALVGPRYWFKFKQTPKVQWDYINRKKKWGCPFKHEQELVLAWHDGYTVATSKGLPE